MQLVQCAADDDGTNSSLSAALIGSSGANLLQIRVGSDASAPGHGYRGVLVSSLVLVLGSAVLHLVVSVIKHRLARSSRPRTLHWRTVAADVGLPGWWLAGPCAMAVAPLLSAAVSLASVSPWAAGTGAADGVLVVAALLFGCALVAWCVKALLRRRHGGWFTAIPRGLARELSGVPPLVRWLLGGACAWAPDPRLRTDASQRFVAAYGSLFMSMWPHRHWWFLVDLSASVLVGLLAALPALAVHRSDAITLVPLVCTGALHAATAVQVSFFALNVVFLPVSVRWEHAFSLISAVLGALGACLASLDAATSTGVDSVIFGINVAQIVVAVVTLLFGVLEDMFAFLSSQPSRRTRSRCPTTVLSKCDFRRCRCDADAAPSNAHGAAPPGPEAAMSEGATTYGTSSEMLEAIIADICRSQR
jgi:hypothetical protein